MKRLIILAVAICLIAIFFSMPVAPSGAIDGGRGPLPQGVLISDTGWGSGGTGSLWEYGTRTGELSLYYQLPFSGSFDIQYLNGATIVIADFDGGRIWKLHLATKRLALLTDDESLENPIGLAVGRGGDLYIADHATGILKYEGRTGVVSLLVEPFEGPADGIALGRDGWVYFTNHSPRLYRVDPDIGEVEMVADAGEGYGLNGIVITPAGTVIAASTWGTPAVLEMDPATGEVTSLWENDLCAAVAPSLRTPEDVAIGRDGTIWVIDSDMAHCDDEWVSGLYRVSSDDPPQLQAVVTGEPFGDVVDILLTPDIGR